MTDPCATYLADQAAAGELAHQVLELLCMAGLAAGCKEHLQAIIAGHISSPGLEILSLGFKVA